MKCISLWQPWASLLVLGIKQFETRGWDTHYRGELAIHATKKVISFDEAFGDFPESIQAAIRNVIDKTYGSYENLPTGSVLGTVDLDGTFATEYIRGMLPQIERAVGNYGDNRFAWHTSNRKMFASPIPAKGKQGFWNWEESQ